MIVCMIIVFVLVTLVLLLNIQYKKTNAYYNQFYSHWNFRAKNVEKIVVLGSTYGRFAFEGFKYLRILNTNYTLNCQSVEDTFKNLNKIRDSLNGNKVFLTLAPCTLMYEGKGLYKLPGTAKAGFKQKLKYLFPIYNPKRLLKLVFDEARYVDVYDSKNQVYDHKTADNNMVEIVNIWKRTFGLENFTVEDISSNNQKIIQKNTIFLDGIAEICEQNGCDLYILIPPFSERLNLFFSDSFVNKVLMNPIQEVLEKHKKIVLINVRQNKEFQDEINYIDGGFLLNRKGSINLINLINTYLKLGIKNKTYGMDYLDYD